MWIGLVQPQQTGILDTQPLKMHAFIPVLPPRQSPKALSTSTTTRATTVYQASPRPSSSTAHLPHPLPSTPAPTPPAAPSNAQTTVVWLRDDLRLHDHPALHAAVATGGRVAPLVLVHAEGAGEGYDAGFFAAALLDLREGLRRLGGELFVRVIREGYSVADAVRSFCGEVCATKVTFHRGVSREERATEGEVVEGLQEAGVTVETFWTGGLYSPGELPFCVEEMPEDCDAFAERLKGVCVGKALGVPDRIFGVEKVECGALPDERKGFFVGGGERGGLERVRDYVQGKSLVDRDIATKGKRLGAIDTKFARLGPFLRMGCVSARLVWHQVMEKVGENCVRRYCAEFELLLRDFVRLLTLKHGILPV